MGITNGRKWTEENTEDAIRTVITTLGINHFPTHSEIKNFYGNCSLTVRISRTGGTRYWADKLNLPIKQCESEVGNDFELKAIEDIKENTGFDSYQTKPRYPYDLVTNQNIRVDVKVSYPSDNGSGVMANTFNLEKSEPTCDIFVLYCLKKDGSVAKTLIIPACILKGKTQVGVGILSKWDFYKDKWNYFENFAEFNESILSSAVVLGRRRSKVVNW